MIVTRCAENRRWLVMIVVGVSSDVIVDLFSISHIWIGVHI